MTPPPRSWLYVPAIRAELLPKALAGPADAVVIDLEDAVPADAKSAARDMLPELLGATHSKPVWVRINHPASADGEQDLAALGQLPVDGVRVPKCEDPQVVAEIGAALHVPMHLLLESALGVEHAMDLATCNEWVRGIALGEADLLADLGGLDATALVYPRGRVICAARAAQLPAPVMSVYTALNDDEGLRSDTLAARAAGFLGRSVVHPRQVHIVNDAFTPSPTEIERAKRIVANLSVPEHTVVGAFVDESGRFIDAAVARQASLVVALADYLDRPASAPSSAPVPEDRP